MNKQSKKKKERKKERKKEKQVFERKRRQQGKG